LSTIIIIQPYQQGIFVSSATHRPSSYPSPPVLGSPFIESTRVSILLVYNFHQFADGRTATNTIHLDINTSHERSKLWPKRSLFLHFLSFVSQSRTTSRPDDTAVETPPNFNVSKISKRLQIRGFSSKRRQIQSFKSISKATPLHFSSMMGSQFQKHGGHQGSMLIELVTPLRLSSLPCSLQHQ